MLCYVIIFYSSCDKITDCIKPIGEIETRIIELDEINAFEIFRTFELVIQEGETQEIEITGHPNVIEALLEDSKIKDGTWDVGIKKCIANWKKSELVINATLPNNPFCRKSFRLVESSLQVF